MIISWVMRPGLGLASLSYRMLCAVVEATARAPVAGSCPVCGRPVRAGEPYVRYRGLAYHAEPCAEQHPPAEMAALRSQWHAAFRPRA